MKGTSAFLSNFELKETENNDIAIENVCRFLGRHLDAFAIAEIKFLFLLGETKDMFSEYSHQKVISI